RGAPHPRCAPQGELAAQPEWQPWPWPAGRARRRGCGSLVPPLRGAEPVEPPQSLSIWFRWFRNQWNHRNHHLVEVDGGELGGAPEHLGEVAARVELLHGGDQGEDVAREVAAEAPDPDRPVRTAADGAATRTLAVARAEDEETPAHPLGATAIEPEAPDDIKGVGQRALDGIDRDAVVDHVASPP